MAQTVRDIKAMLQARGLRPRHRFGQNFLHDTHQLDRIIAASELSPDDLVLEVGPGTGALTERLLEAQARVIAVEIDRDLAALLRDSFAKQIQQNELMLIESDILASKHALALNVCKAIGDTPFKLVANLPYNIASPLLANLGVHMQNMTAAVVMIQQEVAERLIAKPNSKAYGPLGILLQCLFEIEHLFTLSPGCFYPPPKIDSAVVRLVRRNMPLTDDPSRLAALLQTLFQKRRKQLGAILGKQLPNTLNRTLRPENLTIEQMITLSKHLRA